MWQDCDRRKLGSMPPRFPDHLRLPLDFEPARLAADLAAVSGSG